jgi:DNA repair protein RadC
MNLKLALPEPERPRERCLEHGAACLSLKECLALILGCGSARGGSALESAARVLERPAGPRLPPEELARAFFEALEHAPEMLVADLPGLGAANRARLLAVFELARRYAAHRTERGRGHGVPVSPEAAARECLRRIGPALRHDPREWLGFVPVYAHGPGELCLVERGVRTHVNTEPSELFARVLALRPRAFVLAHNHPSGDPRPSDADLQLTERVSQLSGRLGVLLLGHWVVTSETETWIGSPHL